MKPTLKQLQHRLADPRLTPRQAGRIYEAAEKEALPWMELGIAAYAAVERIAEREKQERLERIGQPRAHTTEKERRP